MTRRIAIALAFIAVLLVLLLVAPAPVQGYVRWLQTLHNAAHGPVFAAIAVLCLIALGGPRHPRSSTARQYALALLIAANLGALTELVQVPLARNASLEDLANNLLGALTGLAGFAAFDRALSTRLRVGSGVVVVLLASVLLGPLLSATASYARRHAEFPVLADFSRRLDRYFVAPQSSALTRRPLPQVWAVDPDEHAVRVEFHEGPWPGLDFHEPAPDWRGYTALALDLTNPADVPLDLVLRVHDSAHDQRDEDRFNRRFRLAPYTRATLHIPLEEIAAAPRGRRLDMAKVAGLVLFRSAESGVPEMYISRIWLERETAAAQE